MILTTGDFVILNGNTCVVVGVDGDAGVPEDHVALWYGEVELDGSPIVWTVPAEYVGKLDRAPTYRH